MFAIKILKQEINYFNEKIKALAITSYTSDSFATLEINDLKSLVKDLEGAVITLKEKALIQN